MNSIRNQFAHNLKPLDEKIHSKINNMQMPWATNDSMKRMSKWDIYRSVSLNTVTELKNALKQGRTAMFYPDETEYDKEIRKYL